MIASLFYLFLSTANAAQFDSAFLKMEIPDGWKCKLETNQYLCQDEKYQDKNYAVMVISAKKASSEDTLTAYQKYLSQPIAKVTQDYKELKSKVIKSGKTNRNGVEWVESQHKDSEAKGYITRYMATVHDDVAVLISLSINEKYTPIFDKLFAKTWETIHLKKLEIPSTPPTGDQSTQLLTDQDVGDLGSPSSQSFNFVHKNSFTLLISVFLIITTFFIFLLVRRKK